MTRARSNNESIKFTVRPAKIGYVRMLAQSRVCVSQTGGAWWTHHRLLVKCAAARLDGFKLTLL
jgi:hypothetical protein